MWLRLGLLLSLILALVGCSAPTKSTEEIVRERAKLAMQALQSADGAALANLAHPTKGVRFSPYAFIRTDADLVFQAAKLKALTTDATVYEWGIHAGSGEPIKQTMAQYAERFSAKEYVKSGQVGYNQVVKEGSTQNNLREAYPGAIFIEYHMPGTGEQAEFNWSSVRLVFEQQGNTWYLVGVINDQWTI